MTSPEAVLAAAIAHHRAGALDQAEAGYRGLVAADPRDAVSRHGLGLILLSRGQADAAAGQIGHAARLCPGHARMHFDLGDALCRAGRYAEASDALLRATALDAARPDAWHLLGRTQATLGHVGDATASLRRCLALASLHLGALKDLAASGATDVVEPLRRILDRADMSDEHRMHAHFALAAALDHAGSHDQAFAAVAEANRLLRRDLVRAGQGFSRDALRGYVDARIAAFTPATLAETTGGTDQTPVFIVGMPRSGTTLAERMLASHPAVAGIGESGSLAQAADALDEANRTGSTPAALCAIAQRHLSWLRLMAGDASRVVDKTPDNLFHLGAIARLFPRARIIVCQRDPRDVGLSCHFQGFAMPVPWASDLDDCAFRVQETERMLAHWRQVLPLPMLTLRYEATVADPEATCRTVLAFLGLPWDPACLAFHRQPGVVTSASVWQVRRPVHTGSVGRWRHYRRHLGPLLVAFGGGPDPRVQPA